MGKIKQFGNTWWGKAWIDALEQRALEDPNRLPRGRTYARQDRVRQLELSPGELRAEVWGNRDDPYITTLSMRVMSEDEWDHVLETMMKRASNVASLLAGEVPREIGEYVLPVRGDLGPECSCPDWAEPCKHVAALCYVAADLFDADPFALLTLRGRGRDAVLNEVRERRSERLGVDLAPTSGEPRGADPGTSGTQAYRRKVVPFDRAAPLPPKPSRMSPLAVAPGADAGIDLDELADLVNDASERAWSMLAAGASSQLDVRIGADVVRRAAACSADSALDIETIAKATGVDATELAAAAVAWRRGGYAGFTAHSGKPDVDEAAMLIGASLLGVDDSGVGARVRGNAVSLGRTQLRLDENGQWWHFVGDDELGWLLSSGPANDPNDLFETPPA